MAGSVVDRSKSDPGKGAMANLVVDRRKNVREVNLIQGEEASNGDLRCSRRRRRRKRKRKRGGGGAGKLKRIKREKNQRDRGGSSIFIFARLLCVALSFPVSFFIERVPFR